MAAILLVDDEPKLRAVLAIWLRRHGHAIVEAESGERALQWIESQSFEIALLDVALPGMSGIEVMQQLSRKDDAPTGIMMTAHGSIRSAIDAMRVGAFDYLTKPFDNEELLIVIERALEQRRLRVEVTQLREELETRYGFTDIVGISPAMRRVFQAMDKVAKTDETVLILGESGTGKELVARALHRRGSRAHGPFLAVNCSAIPATLVESEFFGHERGAFTDAKETRAGKFELARKGTIFLDEIGDLPLEAQAKLLRALQERQVTRVGSNKVIDLDVRVIAATHKDLRAAVANGTFREDLFYRLAVLPIHLPPLRDRPEDLPVLLEHLVRTFASELDTTAKAVSAEARALLAGYDWPGNIRELQNVVRRALVFAEGPVVRAADLPADIRGLDEAWPSGGDERVSMADAVARSVARVERGLIVSTLAECDGNRSRAADRLGINRKTLFTKMKHYGLARLDEDEC
jgi:two-component system, NtrC family, response regulator AtoC